MAMNKAAAVLAAKALVKTKADEKWGGGEAKYEELAEVIAEVVDATIQHILDNAVTDPTGDTIT